MKKKGLIYLSLALVMSCLLVTTKLVLANKSEKTISIVKETKNSTNSEEKEFDTFISSFENSNTNENIQEGLGKMSMDEYRDLLSSLPDGSSLVIDEDSYKTLPDEIQEEYSYIFD